MKLKAIQHNYQEALSAIYTKEEINHFFFMLTDALYGIKRIDMALQPDMELENTTALVEALEDLVMQKPIQYILGDTEFYGLRFKVNSNTLIPRPETEELVSWILEEIPKDTRLKILDIGTGSGCIPIALAKHLPEATVFTLDVSAKALQVAKTNAELNDVNLKFIEHDILEVSAKNFTEKFGNFDVIVSNPPYVRESEKALMQPNVLEHEPHLALFVEDEAPLCFYDAIGRLAQQALEPKGQLFFEINEYLGRETIALLETKAFQTVTLKQDNFGKDRMVKAVQ